MDFRQVIQNYVRRQYPVYREMALAIHAKPEVSDFEFFACETLSKQMEQEGFAVEIGAAGHRTGFDARYKSKKPGPVLVFLAEYDALAGLGHGCGHNLFGATSCLAAAALKQVIDEIGGEVRVYGTPGEEGGQNGSAKGSFVREGYLKDVDAALCAHPGAHHDSVTPKSLVCAPIDIEFFGRAAHASSAPEDGINALDALILTYNGINALRQHLSRDIQIHGIVVSGGDAPNIVPAYAHGKFYLRSATVPQMDALWPKIEAIVQGAALMTGARGTMKPSQNRVENTVPTPAMDAIYCEEMSLLGVTVHPTTSADERGSTDCGNISQVVPTIQPHITICEELIPAHTEEFKTAACSEFGLATIGRGAAALAQTACRLILEPELLAKVKEQNRQNVKNQ